MNSIDLRPIAADADQSLWLIRLPLAQPGFDEFLGSWLLRSPSETVLVDCGVAGSYGTLKGVLDAAGLKPDLLLLTHVHLDHCGAAGCLCRDFPRMKVFCFEGAAKHLISPEKLWGSTAATLGQAMAEAYEPPLPVPAENIVSRGELPPCWNVLDTPGHASHHVCYLRDFAGRRVLFGGEALGVFAGNGITSWFGDGVHRSGLRPATPPRYIPEIGRASIEKIARASWDLYCCGHYGSSTDRTLPQRSLRQNLFWEKEIRAALEKGMNEDQIVDMLRRHDPELAALRCFADGPLRREIYFLHNNVRGFVTFLAPRKGDTKKS